MEIINNELVKNIYEIEDNFHSFTEAAYLTILICLLANKKVLTIISSENNTFATYILSRIHTQFNITVLYIEFDKPNTERGTPNTVPFDFDLLEDKRPIIVFSDNVEDINLLLSVRRKPLYWNSRANILVTITNVRGNITDIVDKVHCKLHNLKLNNAVISLIGNCNLSIKQPLRETCDLVVSFNTFHKQRTIVDLKFGKESTLSLICNVVYSSQKYKNLHGFPLYISNIHPLYSPDLKIVVNESGQSEYTYLLGLVINTLSTYMNFSISHINQYKSLDGGSEIENQTWSNLIGDIIKNEADIGLDCLHMLVKRQKVIEFATPLRISRTIFVVKKAETLPYGHALYLPFELPVWVVFCGALIIVLMTMKCLSKYLVFQDNFYSNSSTIYYSLIQIMLQISVRKPPSCVLRIIFFSWVYFTLVMATLYQARVISYLVIPGFYPEINTLEDVVGSISRIKGVKQMAYIFNESSNKYVKSLISRFEATENLTEAFMEVIRNRSIALATSEYFPQYLVSCAFDCSLCAASYHIVPESIVSTMKSFIVAKDSPFLKEINVIINRAKQAGLIQKWTEETIANRTEHVVYRINDCITGTKSVIRLPHVKPVLLVWFVGCIVGTVVLVVEILYFEQNICRGFWI